MQNRKMTGASYFIYAFLIASFILCYFHVFEWLHYKYSYPDSYYSHGYLIPFVSAFLIYLKRHELRQVEPSTETIGLILLVLALVAHVFATMADINFVSGFSMWAYILGFLLYLRGSNSVRIMVFPLCFLLFMFPIPNALINIAGLPTKSIATSAGLRIIDVVGLPYLREGFQIHLQNATLVIGTPCNGMKSLISFLAVAVLGLYVTQLRPVMRLAVLISIVPMAILLNGCRIAALIYIAERYGIEHASPQSYLHDLSGMLVFLVGLTFLFLFVKLGATTRLNAGNGTEEE